MQTEKPYQFRERLNRVHQPGRRDPSVTATCGQTQIDSTWQMVIAHDAEAVVLQAAQDLQDYLFTSMEISVKLVRGNPGETAADTPCLVLATCAELPAFADGVDTPRAYRLRVEAGHILLCGADARGVAQGCFFLEDLMNLAEAPVLESGDTVRQPLFSPRMVHSGWGMDQFPDAHLNSIAHAGMDAILVYAKAPHLTTHGHLDFNDLIARCARFGLDVYFYSVLKSLKHPDDPEAATDYDQTYGALFKACPGARGIILVGESCEFPSQDPQTTGRLWRDSPPDGLPDSRPSPGWWPCRDFPAWLDRVKTAIRRYRDDADIVFWTYNWGWAPEADRLALIKALPQDIALQATFEMHEPLRHENVTHRTCDYTISFAGPGRYFAGEAAEAHRRGLRVYTMANTGGLTWDIGVIPYVPVPQQWSCRHAALQRARTDWNLSGLMESHHFGFFPSIVSDLAKWAYWAPTRDPVEILGALARRDFGVAGAPHALEAFACWSQAMREDYPCTNEDQYGPFRVGPSYPLVFHPNLSMTFTSNCPQMPETPFAHSGAGIVFTAYRPMEHLDQTAGMRRLLVEQRMLKRLRERWAQGLASMERALRATPPRKRESTERMLALGRFIHHTIITVMHVKEWFRLNMALRTATDPLEMHRLLDRMIALAQAEIDNAKATLPLVERDSRLGWEPSMDYMTDVAHLQWKIRQVERVINAEIPKYRRTIDA